MKPLELLELLEVLVGHDQPQPREATRKGFYAAVKQGFFPLPAPPAAP